MICGGIDASLLKNANGMWSLYFSSTCKKKYVSNESEQELHIKWF
jgi:hypothetical protein